VPATVAQPTPASRQCCWDPVPSLLYVPGSAPPHQAIKQRQGPRKAGGTARCGGAHPLFASQLPVPARPALLLTSHRDVAAQGHHNGHKHPADERHLHAVAAQVGSVTGPLLILELVPRRRRIAVKAGGQRGGMKPAEVRELARGEAGVARGRCLHRRSCWHSAHCRWRVPLHFGERQDRSAPAGPGTCLLRRRQTTCSWTCRLLVEIACTSNAMEGYYGRCRLIIDLHQVQTSTLRQASVARTR
jgi:hypothetical protein